MSKQPAKAPCLSVTKAGRPCSFTTKEGRPCRAWAVRGSDPPACSSHLKSRSGERTKEQVCSSHLRASSSGNARGQARTGHLPSVPGEEAPEAAGSSHLSSSHGEHTPEPGFYGHTLSDEELADLVVYAAELSLDDEIACTRIAVRRTLEFLNERPGPLSETEYLRAAGLVFQGTRTIARLLREQQALSGGSDNRLQAIFDAALDGLSEEWGIEL
jgi:hypothetical protein